MKQDLQRSQIIILQLFEVQNKENSSLVHFLKGRRVGLDDDRKSIARSSGRRGLPALELST